jgi:heptosyltransferase-2/heptosyltransferase-3
VLKRELGAEVHFLTSPLGGEILRGSPYIDRIITLGKGLFSELSCLLKVRREGYDAVIDVQRTGRSKRITLFSGAPLRIAFRKRGENFYYNRLVDWKNRGYTVWERLKLLKPLGIENPPPLLPKFFLLPEELERGRELLRELGLREGEFFVVVPTSRRRERSWEPEKFGRLAAKISSLTSLTPLFAYAPGERELARISFEACGKGVLLPSPLPVRLFGALVSLSAFSVGNDSFSSHLSFALGRKSFVILGPNEGWFPEHPLVVKVKKGLECQPCGNWRGCDRGLECYRALSPEEAFSQLKGKL